MKISISFSSQVMCLRTKLRDVGVIKSLVNREAFVMAFNDAFLVISVTLLVCDAAIWFCKPSRAEEAHSSAG